MTTVVEMTSGFTFSEIRDLMNRAIGSNFGYELRCTGTNGPATHAELEVVGLDEEDQYELTNLFVNSVKPIVTNFFGKFEVVKK